MAAQVIGGIILGVLLLVISTWAAIDAKKRGYSTLKIIFIFFLVLIPIIGLILYLILRPSGKLGPCPKCKRMFYPGLKKCPHCGVNLKPKKPQPPAPGPPTKIKCPHCGQLVDNSWKTCPYCSRSITISKTIIDEVFLIYKDGRLIKHFTRRLKPDVDQDILSGMLTAVQEFIKDSFRGEIGELSHMEFGKFQILMGHGRFITVAAVLMGEEIEPFRPQIIKAIDSMESDYEVVLRDWKGEMDQLNVLGRYIMDLIDGRYA